MTITNPDMTRFLLPLSVAIGVGMIGPDDDADSIMACADVFDPPLPANLLIIYYRLRRFSGAAFLAISPTLIVARRLTRADLLS